MLAAGCGLIAYGAVDRVPGAAWLGVAHLVAFLVVASAGADDTLLWWPLLLLALGGGVLVAGLRPRSPLPPEPDGYSVDRPLASRADDDELVVRVRNDDPPVPLGFGGHDRRRARRGGVRARLRRRAGAPSHQVLRAGQAAGARARRAAARPRLVLRGRAARQLGGRRARRRRRRHRHGHDRRPHRRPDGERPDGQGRLVGPQDGGEDPPHPGGRARPPRADGLPRRLRRRAHHRAGADVPRPAPRRPHLLQRGQALGRGAAGLRAVRPERGRRRLHPRVLRRRDHARRQRVDVPRLAAHGRDGDRRARVAGGDGRREDAHGRLGLRPLPRQDRRGGDRARQALPRLPAVALGGGAAGRAARRRRPRTPGRSAS